MWTTTANYTLKATYRPLVKPAMFSLPSICGGDPVEGLAMLSALVGTYGAASSWLVGLLNH